jgi:N utilization substance protein A
VAGRCAAILANGKRCPNASLPGSRYCGLPAHQELEGKGTDHVVPPEEGGEEPQESAEEAMAGEPSSDALVAAQPSVEEVLEDKPAAEELVEEQPSVEEIVDGQPAAEEVVEEATPEEDGAGGPGEAEPVAETTAEARPEEEES